MQHVIITLPQNLWEAILTGKKLFEIRKAIPRIAPFSGCVYVCLKGSVLVVGFFTLRAIIGSDDEKYIWELCSGNIAVTKGWFMKYAQNKSKYIFAWEIDAVYKFMKPCDRETEFNIKGNPQSFVYTQAEPVVDAELVRGIKHTVGFLARNQVMPISIYYHDTWFDNIPTKNK